jgi:phage terminase large subunit-like protein
MIAEQDLRTTAVLAVLRAKYAPRPPVRVPYPWQVAPPQPWDVWLLLGGEARARPRPAHRYVDAHANGPACLEGPTPHRIAIIAPVP